MAQKENGVFPYTYITDIFSGGLFNAAALAEGEPLTIDYVFDCPEFQQLRERYPIERAAGRGGDFERALRLCRYLAPRLKHQSDYDNHIPCHSLALLDYCFEKPDVGINCLNKAKILAECCLALGIYARRCIGLPCSPYDGDNHVVTEIYDRKRQKWIALDPTYGSYFSDGVAPLSCLELRQAFAARSPVSAVLNRQNPARIDQLQKRNAGVNWYYAKNSYYFAFDPVSTFGVPEGMSSIYVVPEGFDLQRQRIKSLENWKVLYGRGGADRSGPGADLPHRLGGPVGQSGPGRAAAVRNVTSRPAHRSSGIQIASKKANATPG